LEETLQALWPGRTRRAISWDAWARAVQRLAPSLLVLVTHTAKDKELSFATLEIEHEALALMELDESHVCRKSAEDGLLMLLLGCSTALPSIKIQSFVGRILRLSGGRAVVVSSIASMLGRHAAPTAAALLSRLNDLVLAGPVDVGEAFLRLRRELLLTGDPLMLCLAVYGDADWLLVAPSTAEEHAR
jgi:hypothetical protein